MIPQQFSGRFIVSSRQNPCPICDRSKDEDCRTSQNGELILCHTRVEGKKGDTLNGFVWVGQTTDPLDWGQWVVPREKNPDYRPVGQEFRFPYTNDQGLVICTKVRVYQKQPDGSVKKKDRWTPSKVDSTLLMPYQYLKAIAALKANPDLPLFIDESEMTADLLWSLGLPTIAFGRSISDARIKKLLSGFESRCVACVDRDQPGFKKADRYLKLFPMAATLKPYPESDFWLPGWLPESDGLDVRDWILEGNLTKEQILESVERPEPTANGLDTAVEDGEAVNQSRFESILNDGLYQVSFECKKGEVREERTRVGNHLIALGYLDSPDQDSAALALEFQTVQGQTKRWTMLRSDLGGDKTTVIGQLLARGYGVSYEQRGKLHKYLLELGSDITDSYTISDKTGWVDGSFLLPDKTIGDQSIRFRDIEPLKDCPTEVRGTVESWGESVGKLAEGNSRLLFGVGAALASPLTPLLEIESGGFHLVGATSTGKTTTLNVAASVVGLKRLGQWNSTVNGLEAIATAHNHLPLLQDEIGQCNPKDVGQAAYLLGNGQGKQRMTRELVNRKPKQWQLLFLSSGELTLSDYLKQAGISQKGGQEVRCPDIPAVPKGGKYGVFETIHDYSSAVEFVAQLEMACRENRGAVFVAYLERLVSDHKDPDWLSKQRKRLWAIANELSSDIQDEAISRAAKRFALVQLGLEIAHGYGLLFFPFDQCSWAVKTIFEDWVDARGGSVSIEIRQALERIELEFEKNQFSHRVYNLDLTPDSPVNDLFCYRKKDEFTKDLEYWVPSAVFRELCKGVDRDALIAEMQARGWLKTGDAEGKAALRRWINNKQIRAYVFTHFWNGENSGVRRVRVSGTDSNQYGEGDPEQDTGKTPPETKVSGVSGDPTGTADQPDTRTPGKNDVSGEVSRQDVEPETVSDTRTPRTPRTPQKTESLKLLSEDDDQDGDY